MISVQKIFISPASNYWGRPRGKPGDAPTFDLPEVECHAGKGLVGDRFYQYKEAKYQGDYDGQITFFSFDHYRALEAFLNKSFDPIVFRRNVLLAGIDPLELAGKIFSIGEVRFEGRVHCSPCAWMDTGVGQGAFKWMSERQAGGLRARILTSGLLRVGDQLQFS